MTAPRSGSRRSRTWFHRTSGAPYRRPRPEPSELTEGGHPGKVGEGGAAPRHRHERAEDGVLARRAEDLVAIGARQRGRRVAFVAIVGVARRRLQVRLELLLR